MTSASRCRHPGFVTAAEEVSCIFSMVQMHCCNWFVAIDVCFLLRQLIPRHNNCHDLRRVSYDVIIIKQLSKLRGIKECSFLFTLV